MQSLLDTFDWRSPQSDHEEVLRAHRARVERSAHRIGDQLTGMVTDPAARLRLLDHPDFYAYLLEQLRGAPPDRERLRKIAFTGPEGRLSTGAALCFVGYSADERASIADQIEAALTELKGRAPKAQSFIKAMMQMLVCRRRDEFQYLFTSSQNSHLGRVTFDNVLGAPRVKIMEGLVHESVHSYLYMVEEKGRFLSTTSDPRAFIRSPWTGNKICLHSFVHACFVWYSLSTLPHMKDEDLEFIRRGFAKSAFEYIVLQFPTLIGPRLREMLMRVREVVLAAG